jgi:hypothetical protein
MTTIFLLTSAGLLFALSTLGIVWIRATVAEYRHRWGLPQEALRSADRTR